MAYLGQPGGAGQGLSVSGGVPAWSNPGQNVRTTYELDFGTVTAENPILSGAGTTTRTYNGVTWTFTNTTTGGAVSQVTSAAGLTHSITNSTSAAVTVPIVSLGVASAAAGPWRAWIYFSAFTTSASTSFDNYLYSNCLIGSTSTSTIMRGCAPGFNANYYGQSGPTASGANLNRIQPSYPSYDILVLECVGGNFITRMGLYSSGHWTSLENCQIMTIGSPSDSTLSSATSGIASTDSALQILSNKFSGTSATNTIKLFKIEVW